MGKFEDLIDKILKGRADANIAFRDICQLLRHLEFDERIRGSHHTFRKQGIEEKINIQRDGNKAKAYQVRQVRNIILKYHLGGNE